MDKDVAKYSLTNSRAKELLLQYGSNTLPEKKPPSVFVRFFAQFENALMLLLVGAGSISLLVGERIDALFIFLIVLLNAGFGLYQEFKAERALATLKELTVTNVRVFRDGVETEIDSRMLVPGDLIHIEEGNKIPADAQVLDSLHLETNESALTGESMPIEKNQKNREVFMGTTVAKGRGYARVTETGVKTKFGKIAQTLGDIVETKTPLQKKLESFTKQVGFMGIFAALSVFILSFIQDKTVLESFLFAVSLAVAAVPEGLPAVMTITLALGVERMAKKNAIVRKLNAIETLGSITIVATDKTGTLTTNKMRVKKVWAGVGKKELSLLLTNSIVCSTATLHSDDTAIGDPTEGALLIFAKENGYIPQNIRAEWKTVDELSFNAQTKRMTVVASKENRTVVYTKGSPESILAICKMTSERRTAIENDFLDFAKKGYRIIAFSYKETLKKPYEQDQIFLGFVGIADPIRPEVYEAVQKARNAGIRTIMITGDNALTAQAIGIEAGIITTAETAVTGTEIENLTDEQLLSLLPKVTIFARTTPNQKYRLVQLYQKLGETVAVTGDGINDALALKQADVGVAMGKTGTDVAKETADMVITDDNFATLIGAIEEGRHIFSQIKNSIKYLLSCNFGEILYILPAVVFNMPVLSALQILYMNIATDGLPAISLAFTGKDTRVMRSPPKRSLSILEKGDFRYIVLIGVLTALTGYIAQIFGVTVLFTSIMLMQHFVLIDVWLSHRSVVKNFFSLKHPVFLLAFLLPVLIHPLLLYHPFLQNVFGTQALSFYELSVAVGIAVFIFLGMETVKLFAILKSR